jgi:PIN domain nuclease of toxin-antitoxin system
MKVLLDTHAFLWALIEPGKLSPKARRLLEDDATDVLVSAASAWEIATKFRLGRVPGAKRVVANYSEALRGLRATQLAITSDHALKAGSWNVAHRDPFDRMLAAQSDLEKLALISCDPAMKQFGIKAVW